MKKLIALGLVVVFTLAFSGICFADGGQAVVERMQKQHDAYFAAKEAGQTPAVKVEAAPRANYTEGLDARIANYTAKINAGTMTAADKVSLVADIKASREAMPFGGRPALTPQSDMAGSLEKQKAFDKWDTTDNTLRHLGHKAGLTW